MVAAVVIVVAVVHSATSETFSSTSKTRVTTEVAFTLDIIGISIDMLVGIPSLDTIT
jgi:hypothetical protein